MTIVYYGLLPRQCMLLDHQHHNEPLSGEATLLLFIVPLLFNSVNPIYVKILPCFNIAIKTRGKIFFFFQTIPILDGICHQECKQDNKGVSFVKWQKKNRSVIHFNKNYFKISFIELFCNSSLYFQECRNQTTKRS